MKTFSFSHCASHRGFIPIRSTNNSRSIRAKRFNAVFCAAWQCVEALESRTLLSSVSGTVYSDLNLSGSRSTGDPGLAGIQVFDDLNGTGQYQAGDPSATTASDGSYVMYNVPLNTPQIICVSLPTGWDESTADDGTTSVTLTSAARHVTDVDFGLWQPITGISAQDINLDEGQAFTGSVATVTDSAGGYADPNNYSGTLTLNGTSAVGFELDGDGNLIGQPANFPNLSVGTYGAEVDVTESDNGHSFSGSAQFTVTVNGVPISAQGASSSAQTGIPWTGTIATFTDPDPNAAIGNYSASINYGDGTTPSAGTISYDGSGGWLVTDTHTFAYDENFTPTVTIEANDFSNDVATATSSIAVALSSFSLNTPNVEFTEGDSFNGIVGTVTEPSAVGNYSGTLSINGSSYSDISFPSLGNNAALVQSNDFPALPAGSYDATLGITLTGQTSSVSTTSTFTVTVDDTPYTNVTPVDIGAYAGVPWTGTVATFDHFDVNPQAGNYTATIQYDGLYTTPGTISSDGNGGWIVTATLTYPSPGNYSPIVTLSDNGGGSATVGISAAVTLAPLSLSASNLDLEQGQSFGGDIGLLTDTAGSYSNPINFSASLTWDGWIYGNLSFSPDPAGPGMWDIVASGLPALAAGTYPDSLSVTETDSATGQSVTTDPVSFSVSVIPPTLYASGQYINAMVGQSWSGTLATVSDNDPYDQPSIYDTASTNYGDGSAATDSQISAGSTSWTVTDTHTFISAGSLSPYTTISDSNGNEMANSTATANVNLAPISLAASDVWMNEGQSLAGLIGTLTDQAGYYAAGNYSGALTLTDNATSSSQTYSVNFDPDSSGLGLYDAEAAGAAPLSAGLYTAVLQATESCSNGQSVDASSTFAVNVAALPLSVQGASISSTVGQSWTGTVAAFTDPDPAAAAGNYSATINYGDGTASSTGTISSDGNGGWLVTDTHTFPGVGSFSPTVTLNDNATGGSYQVSDSAALSPASIYLSASQIQIQEGQALSTIATLTDGAGSYASGNYYGTLSLNGNSYSVGFTSDGNNDGGFSVQANNVPLLSAGVYSATLDVSEDIGGTTVDATPVALSIDVADAPLTATGQNIGLYGGVPWTGTIATFSQAAVNPQASDYTASLYDGNGTWSTAAVSSDNNGGWIVTGTLSYPVPGNYSPTVYLSDNAGGSTSVADSVAVNFASVSLSAANLYLYQNQSYTGVIGTVVDAAGSYSNPANYSASLTWGDGSSDTNLTFAADGPGQWDVMASNLPVLPGGESSASLVVTESADGQSIATNPANFSVDVMQAQGVTILNATVNSPWYGTIATVSDTDPSDVPSNYTASTDYGDAFDSTPTAPSTGSIAQGYDSDWIVTDTHTFVAPGTYSPTTALVNTQSGATAATATSFASVNLAAISLSTPGMWPVEGQSIDGAIGTLTDSAGMYATGNYTGTVTFSDNPSQSYPVIFVPDGNDDGGYSMQASGLPQFSIGWHNATVAVSESSADLTQTVETSSGLSIYVADAPLYLASDSPSLIGAAEGQPATFTLLHFTSADPNAAASQYTATVNWGDGSTDQSTDPNPNISIVSDPNGGFDVVGTHTFGAPSWLGSFYGYYGSVAVQDQYGAQVSNGFAVQVTGAALSAAGDTPASVTAVESQPLNATVLHFTVADPNDQPDDFSAYVSWGDSTNDSSNDGNVTITADPNGGFDVVGNHTYMSTGTYAISMTVQGDAGVTLNASVTANITTAPLAVASDSPTSITAVENQSVTANLLHFTDPDSYDQPGDFTTNVIWGDGWTSSTSTSGVTIAADPNGGFDVIGDHVFNFAGNFTVSVTVQNNNDASTVTGGPTATVADVPPTLAGDSPSNVTGIEGQSFTGTLLHFFQNPEASPSDYTVDIDWGDGTDDNQDGNISIVSDPNGGFDVVGTHTFASMNTYNVTVTATDPSGESVSNTVAATIAPITSTFTATPVNTGAIDLEWSLDVDPGTVSNIEVDRSTSPSSGFAAVPAAQYLPGDSVSYIDNNPPLTEGTQYYYELQVSIAGETYTSPVVNAWTAPAAPWLLTAAGAGSTAVNLSWQNNSGDALGFQIERAGEDGVYQTVGTLNGTYAVGSTVTYTDDTASAESTYTYQVQTIGDGGFSNPPTVSNAATTFPAVPTVSAVAASSTQIDLTWINNSMVATGWKIFSSTDGATFTLLATLTTLYPTSYANTGLNEDSHYYYRVEATAGSTASDPGTADAFTDAAVDTLTATPASTSEIDLSWNLNTIAATAIEVDRSTDGGSTWTKVTNTLPGNAVSFEDTGLNENTTYTYQVRAIEGTTDSAYTTPVTAGTLPDIYGLSAAVASPNEIDLNWTLYASDATAIEVDRSTDGTNFTMLTGTLDPSLTSYADTTVSENTPYWYQVEAITPAGVVNDGAATNTSTPAVVDSLAATVASASEIDLSWNLNVSDASAVEVDRSADGGSTWTTVTNTLSGSATSYPDTGLSENTDYTYRVRAILPGGDSNYTDPVDATTLAAVSGLVAVPMSPSEIDLMWDLNVTDASAIEVDCSVDGGTTWTMLTNTLSGSATSYPDSGLNENTDYTYRVRAIRPGGDSAYTDPADSYPEAAITGLTATPISTGSVDLSWALNIDPAAVSAIEVDVSTDGGQTYTVLTNTLAATATTFPDTGLAEGQPYTYQARAILTAGGYSSYSDPASASTTPIQNLTATTNGAGEIDLSWVNLSGNASAVEVERSVDGVTYTPLPDGLPGNATTYPDTGLTDNTHYWYEVCAVEASGPSTLAGPADAWTLPSAPAGFTLSASSPSEVDLSWAADANPSTTFSIARSDDGGETFSSIGTTAAGATSYADTTVADGTSYLYQIAALSGDGSDAVTSSYNVAATTGLIVPTDVTAVANGAAEIDLSWTDDSQAATGYTVERSADGLDFTPIPTDLVTGNSCSDTTVDPGTRYYYRVEATDDAGALSAASKIVSALTDPTAWVFYTEFMNGSSGVDRSVLPGGTVTIGAASSYASDLPDPITQWVINWGDAGGDVTYAGDPSTFSYVYSTNDTPGVYTVVATAYNAAGPVATSGSPLIIQVLVPQPTLSLSNIPILVDAGSAVSLAPVLGLDGATPLGGYTVDWGDGSAPQTYAADATAFTHTYAQGGSGYEGLGYGMTVSMVTSAGVISTGAAIQVAGVNPQNVQGADNLELAIQDQTTGDAAVNYANGPTLGGPGTGSVVTEGDTISAVITDLAAADHTETVTYTVDWGDSTSAGGGIDSGSFTPSHDGATVDAMENHVYAHHGLYVVTLTASDNTVQSFFVDVGVPELTMTLTSPSVQTVQSGTTVTVTATYSGAASDAVLAAFIDPEVGSDSEYETGPLQATVTPTGDGSGTISVQYTSPPTGTYYPQLALTDLDSNSNAGAELGLYVWSITIGDGTNGELLAGSTSGDGNLLPVAINFPHPAGVALDLTLQTSDADDVDVWNDTSPDPASAPILGGGVSSVTIQAQPGDTDYAMEIGAVDDSATETSAVSAFLSLTATVSTTRSTTVPAGQLVPASAVKTNPVAVIGRVMQVATINDGNRAGILPAAAKMTTGAFVPLDNNDWNYNKTPDLQDNGAVEGDKYLLPIDLPAVPGAPPGARYQFVASNPNLINIWGKQNKTVSIGKQIGDGAEVLNRLSGPNANQTVYIEGISEGTTTLSLYAYMPGVMGTFIVVDSVKITVFAMNGALDVPGGQAYNYTADVPSGKWIAPTGSTAPLGIGNANSVWIKWNNVPEVAFANYEADPNYIWSCGVNVVSVKVSSSEISYLGSEPYQLPVPRGKWPDGFYPTIMSSDNMPRYAPSTGTGPFPAMNAFVTVNVQGPMVSEQERGVQYIDFGAIQNAEMTEDNTLYQGGVERALVAEGQTFLDVSNSSGSGAPWADSSGIGNRSPQLGVNTGLPEYVPPPSASASPPEQYLLQSWDTPGIQFTDLSGPTPAQYSNNGNPPIYVNALDNFSLFVAAHTVYGTTPANPAGVNGSGNVFPAIAEANWYFDGSGDITASGVWSPAGCGVGGDVAFGPPTTSPITTGTLALNVPTTFHDK